MKEQQACLGASESNDPPHQSVVDQLKAVDHEKVVRMVMATGASYHDAQDATQNVIANLIQNPQPAPDCPIEARIVQRAKLDARDEMRKTSRRTRIREDGAQSIIEKLYGQENPSPSEECCTHEDEAKLWRRFEKFIGVLPEKQALVLALKLELIKVEPSDDKTILKNLYYLSEKIRADKELCQIALERGWSRIRRK